LPSFFDGSLPLPAENVTTNAVCFHIFTARFFTVINHEQTLRHQAKNDAHRDFLTGLTNRHAFDERMALEIEVRQAIGARSFVTSG
jgi:GGDEF domain-containing protein